MKTTSFDASLKISLGELGRERRGFLVIGGKRNPASFAEYEVLDRTGEALVRVSVTQAVDVKWLDPFEVQDEDGRTLGKGRALHPSPQEQKKFKPERRAELLDRLSLGEGEMLLALTEEKGIRGLRFEEVEDFCHLDRARIEDLARQLEEDDTIRILSFSPLFVVSKNALNFLRERILDFLSRFHKTHPDKKGPAMEKIGQRFGSPQKIMSLVLRSLVKDGRVRWESDIVSLADFRIAMTSEGEELLRRIEDMLYRGEFATATLQDIRRQLRLSEGRLQTLLSVLTERQKIVKSRDGFILHSKWLDDTVRKIRESGKQELSVGDFKAMTGLSRKYAIPLLELLDEMGVTRRKGAVREIL